jgi:hypothetical protein
MLNGSAADTVRAAPAVDIGIASETAVTLCYSARHSPRHRITPPIVKYHCFKSLGIITEDDQQFLQLVFSV